MRSGGKYLPPGRVFRMLAQNQNARKPDAWAAVWPETPGACPLGQVCRRCEEFSRHGVDSYAGETERPRWRCCFRPS